MAPDLFVTHIDVKTNTITVGPRNDSAINQKIVHLKDRHRIGKAYETPIKITAKIRYRQVAQPATLTHENEIIFQEEQRSIPPGQVAVAYIGEECIGS
ncbi:MAG: aminomethyltransferase beta-barrel domain-containing protein [bacterium]